MAFEHGEPPTKRVRHNFRDTISVVVGTGPAERTFTVHKEKLCARSPYFQAACSARWTEGRDKIIRLPEQEPEYFELYVHWTYSGQVDMNVLPEPEATASGRCIAPTYLQLGKVWAMGHYFGDVQLRNHIIDVMISRVDKVSGAISVQTLQQTWAKTPPDSTIRRLYVQIVVSSAKLSDFERKAEQWPIDVFEEATRRYYADEPTGATTLPKWFKRCIYHEHEAGEPKCS